MLRRTRTALLLLPVLALLTAGLFPNRAQTLPLFARKYKMECTMCHSAFPRLNKFGLEFRQRGYRLEGADGTSPWEEDAFPVSLVGNVGVHYSRTDTASAFGGRDHAATNAFEQNWVEFHTAGTLAKKITFHFDNGFANGAGGILVSGMAFVQFDDLAKNGALNVKAGIYDAEIPYLSSSRRTTLTDYMAPLTLDGHGIELNGKQQGWWYAAGVINSQRMFGRPSDKTLNNLENVYAWLMRDVGPHEVTARVFYDQQDPRAADKRSSPVTQVDLSAMLNASKLVVIPAYIFQKFADPIGADKAHSGLLEAMCFLDKENRWVLTGRYEIQHMASSGASAEQDLASETLNIAWYANPNAKVGVEWSHMGDNAQGPRVSEAMAYVHIGY